MTETRKTHPFNTNTIAATRVKTIQAEVLKVFRDYAKNKPDLLFNDRTNELQVHRTLTWDELHPELSPIFDRYRLCVVPEVTDDGLLLKVHHKEGIPHAHALAKIIETISKQHSSFFDKPLGVTVYGPAITEEKNIKIKQAELQRQKKEAAAKKLAEIEKINAAIARSEEAYF